MTFDVYATALQLNLDLNKDSILGWLSPQVLFYSVVRHSNNMPQPSQLTLEEQVFSRSYSSFLEELSVWYFLPPSDAEDALQTADVKCLEGLDVSSIEGPVHVSHN